MSLNELLAAHGGQVNGVEDQYTACMFDTVSGLRAFWAAVDVDCEPAGDGEAYLDVNVYAMPGAVVA